MGKITDILVPELGNDPLVRGYSGMTDQQVVDDMALLNRPVPADVASLANYLATHTNRTNEGADTTATAIAGRLQLVADATPLSDPFGRGGAWEAGAAGLNLAIAADPANTITFGVSHDISSLDVKDPVELLGFGADDGLYRIDSIVGQVVTVHGTLSLTETLNRVAFVRSAARAKLISSEQRDAARAFLSLSAVLVFDFSSSEVDSIFTAMEDAGVWKAADSAAIRALSENLQTRGNEIGFGVVRLGDVASARTFLP